MAMKTIEFTMHRELTDSILIEYRRIPMRTYLHLVKGGRERYLDFLEMCVENDFPDWDLLSYELPEALITEGLEDDDEEFDSENF